MISSFEKLSLGGKRHGSPCRNLVNPFEMEESKKPYLSSSEDEDDLKPQHFLYGEDDERYENNGAAVAELVRVKSMASLEELQLQCASKKRRLDEVERRANASSNATEAATSSS